MRPRRTRFYPLKSKQHFFKDPIRLKLQRVFLESKTVVTPIIFKREAMRRYFRLLQIMAGVVLLVACTREIFTPTDLQPVDKSEKPLVEIRFKASNPNSPGTRTSMEATADGYLPKWNAGDRIGATSLVFEEVENEWGYTDLISEVFPFETAEGGSSATFTGRLMADNTYHFFYPAQYRLSQMEGGWIEVSAASPGDAREMRNLSGKGATRSSDEEGDEEEGEEEYPEFMDSRIDQVYYLYEMNADGEWTYFSDYSEEEGELAIPVATTSVPVIQYPQAGSFDGYADIMVATNTVDVPLPESGVSTVEIEASPEFKRLVSFLKTSVKDQTEGWFEDQHIQSVYLETENSYEDHLTLPYDGYIDLKYKKIGYQERSSSRVEARYTEDTWYTPASDGSQSTYFVVLPGKIHAQTNWGSNVLIFGGETEDVRFRKDVILPEDIILEEGKVTSLTFTITRDQASRRPAISAIDVAGETTSFDIGGRTKEIGFTPSWEDDGKGLWMAQEILDPGRISITSSNPQVAVASIVKYDEEYATEYNYDTPFLTYFAQVSPVSKGEATITVSYGSVSSSFTVSVDDPEYIYFADPAVKAVAVTLQEWDYNGDGEISVNEAKDITVIPSYAFDGNTDIVSFDELATYFPNVRSISTGAFRGCKNLASITFPEGLMGVYKEAFSGCTSLLPGGLTLPDNCGSIGEKAFYDCSALTEIHLSTSKSVGIGPYAFSHCANVTNVTGLDASEDGRCIIQGDGNLFYFFPAGLTTYKFPASVKKILYSYQTSYALDLMSSNPMLKELDFSDTGLTSYDSDTNSQVTGYSQVERIILPRGMTSFGDYCFGGSIKDVVFTSPSVPRIGYYPFSSANNVVNFYVPFQSYNLYMDAFASYNTFTSKAKPDITDVVCTGFTITASDVHGRESKTKIDWTYNFNGTLYTGEAVTGQVLTGTAVSEDFGRNEASSPRTVTVSYTMLGETAYCQITQGAWDTNWVSAQPDEEQWREAISVQSVEGVPFAYNLYESNSNYTSQDGNANIQILVEGYQHKTITFYVNTSGHINYSYLWVMKANRDPLPYMYNSDYANDIIMRTYGKSGSSDGIGYAGNKFSHYIKVTVPDVSDGDVIWVQYGKSEYWWNTPWNGRGFLLMPLVQD